jgi:hypothetical protein
MRKTIYSFTILLFILQIKVIAQQRVFNQNSSRSNNAKSALSADTWIFGISSGTSAGIKRNENSGFRGSGIAGKMFGRYYFGNIGLGFSTGIIPGTIDDNALNTFITERKYQRDLLQITTGKPVNSYFLFGPSVRFGRRVQVAAELQGGMFLNNPGSIVINQSGVTRSLYRFDEGTKNMFPGFSGNMNISYPVNSSTHFFISTDYLQSRSSVRLLDPQRGIDVPTEQNRNLKLFTAGVGITKSFGSRREAGSGMATGKKHAGNVKYEEITIKEVVSAEEPIITTVQQHAINTKGTGVTRIMNSGNESCGPVTIKKTNTDGSIEEMTFACPDDAINYSINPINSGGMPNRISMNVTVPKQTQGATFGEKVNQGLHAAGGALAQGASLLGSTAPRQTQGATFGEKQKQWLPSNFRTVSDEKSIISGNISWSNTVNSSGIVTNENAAVSSVSTMAGGSGGGAAAASYARTANNITGSTGNVTIVYGREAGSGMASGRRSREAGSGMATGRRQYQPVFSEEENNTCSDCGVTVKLIGHELAHTVQQGSVKNNPLYNDKNNDGSNPLNQSKGWQMLPAGSDCARGITGIDITLFEAASGIPVARTKTGSCGDFFFANISTGDYIVKVSGSLTFKKVYDAEITKKTDMAGIVQQGDNMFQLTINTDNDMSQRAGISTSRSNIRNKSISIIESDMDGDGNFESLKVITELTDGTAKDVTANARISNANNIKKVTVRGWNPEKKEGITSDANTVKEYTFNITGGKSEVSVTTEYETGTKKDAQLICGTTDHFKVRMITIPVGDLDGDGAGKASLNTTRSNIKTVIMTGGNGIAGNRAIGSGASLLGGALPGGAVISAAMRPGGPIPGVGVNLGRKPGAGNLRTAQTNGYGEFEFTDLEPGSYTFTTEQNIIIDDESLVTAGGNDDGDEASQRKGWDGTVKGGMIKDNNVRKGWDGTVKGRMVETGNIGDIVIGVNEPVTFRWTPLVPKPQQPVTYRLKVWQLMQGQNSTQAMRTNKPIVTKDVDNFTEVTVDNIYTGPCKPPYLCDFIWQVQTLDRSEKPIGNNEGKSELYRFGIQEAGSAKPPVLVSPGNNKSFAEADAANPITFRWTPLVPKPQQPVTYRLKVWQLMQGQNSTQAMRTNKPIVTKDVSDITEITIDNIYTGPCKPPYLCDFVWNVDAINAKGNSVNENAIPEVFSFSVANKLIAGDTDNVDGADANRKGWDGTVKGRTAEFNASLDELNKLLDADKNAAVKDIAAAKESSRKLSNSINQLEKSLDNPDLLKKASAAVDTDFAILLASLGKLGTPYGSISNVLKTKHDTAKNSVGNIR